MEVMPVNIGGLQKLTLLDYPGKIACTVFTVGCNLRCPFCHNASLVTHPQDAGYVTDDELFSFLKKRHLYKVSFIVFRYFRITIPSIVFATSGSVICFGSTKY